MSTDSTIRLGIMGGTFNPIHYGHLVTAEEARIQFSLEKVIFVPTGDPVHKRDKRALSAEDRYLMTVIATSSNPYFTVSRIEIDRPGPSYTIDTVKKIGELYRDAKIYFITGADAVWEIITWKDPEELFRYCDFIAATRPGYSLKKFEDMHVLTHLAEDKKKLPQVNIMEIPALAISSTDIRKRVKTGHTIRYLVPEGIWSFIYKSGFYR